MLKIYDDKLAEEICARMDEEILALDAHITELLNYGKLPEIVASMQARREAAERVKSNIRRVNDEAHRIDAEAAAELRKETEKLRAFSQKLDDINAMLVSVMKPEAVNLSNDSGVGVRYNPFAKFHYDPLAEFKEALERYEASQAYRSAKEYLTQIGITEDTPQYKKIMAEYAENSAYILSKDEGKENSSLLLAKSREKLYEDMILEAIYTVYVNESTEQKLKFDEILIAELKKGNEKAKDTYNKIGILYTEVHEVMGEMRYEAGGIKEWDLTEEEYNQAHNAMLKYRIVDREEVALFLANAIVEVGTIGKEQEYWERYVEETDSMDIYRGGGALQLTGDYNYRNYAISLLIKKHPEFKEAGLSEKNRNNYLYYNAVFEGYSVDALEKELEERKRAERLKWIPPKANLEKAVRVCTELRMNKGYDDALTDYKAIVDGGNKHVAQYYAWDSAG